MQSKILKFVDSAKDKVKNLEQFVDLSLIKDRKKLTNKKILSSLKSLGVATQEEVNELKKRIETLEKELKAKTVN